MVKKNYTNGSLSNTVYSWTDGFETKDIAGGGTQTTNYYFANGELVAKKNPDGSIYYVHNDHLGSSSVLTNSTGALVESTTYDPWGEIKSGGTTSKFLYTGQEHDTETNLDYYNARYYNPHIHRFTQPDTYTGDIYNPQDLNEYSYVLNNPLRYTDPSGHFEIPIIGNVIDAASAVYDLVKVVQQPKSVTNWVALGLDVASAVIPGVPDGAGEAYRVAKTAVTVARDTDKAASVVKGIKNTENIVNDAREVGQVLHGSRNPTTKATAAYGRYMHATATYEEGLIKEYNRIPGVRLDAANPETRKFVELKPETESGIRKGNSQIEYYEKYLKDVTGVDWTGELRTYNPPTASQLEDFMR